MESAGRQFVRVDGKAAAAFDAVVPSSLTFSDDGKHVAYAARRNGAWFVVRDGVVGQAWDAIGELDVAFIGRDHENRTRAIVGDLVGAPFDQIEGNQIVFSTDGSRFGYTGRRGAGSVVVVDGLEKYRETWASQPVLASTGRIAYLARRGQRAAIVVDGRSHEVDIAVDGTFAFSADERHWACLAGATHDRELYFLVDGKRGARLEFEEVISASGQFSMQDVLQGRADAVIQKWAVAEANLASSHEGIASDKAR